MEGLDRWKIADELNVYQMALLLAGYDPALFESISHANWPPKVITAVSPFLVSLKNAVSTDRLETLRACPEFDSYNWDLTLIDVTKLRVWLATKGMTGTFFDPQDGSQNEVLDLNNSANPFHSPKLAAAVGAWTAVASDTARCRGKSPKQALTLWLTENAAQFGLLNRDGSPNKQGIEEIAKVANWQPNGGAPKTPSASPEPFSPSLQTPGQVSSNPAYAYSLDDLDDDIPF